ncbi:MAG: leucine--tRNA ligase [Rickettsiales bacterium]|jgi:leucyl-tRNA synthetase|nr:leucine--tRNA ligase [Rickettsiales bacterium]
MTENIKKIRERESKWQKRWFDARAFVPKNDGSKPRFYYLIEFPFLSGAGMHAGHMLTFSGIDVLARWRRRAGFDVLYPIGYDAMGITAEHYATKIGRHPADVVKELVAGYTDVIRRTGWSVNFETIFATSDPDYVKWTQWMFIQFFKAGLAFKTDSPMNWCPSCKTTLTNEELEDGKCERCRGPVEKRMKSQWTLGMSKYADRLIDDLATVDYQEDIKTAQINWIGRSFGADVDFRVGDDVMTVYTTRVDTIFGVTFAVLAPEHSLIKKWLADGKIQNCVAVREYISAAKAKSDIDRTDNTKEKTGVLLQGVMAANPFTGAEIPLFISDYVLADYGYGAVMGVPAHDQRDWDFAKKFKLPIIQVLAGGDVSEKAWEEDGLHINSGFMDGMNKEEAISAAIKFGGGGGFARAAKQYKLKDWGFSRQMYWGEPIPMIYCEKCGWVPVPDDQLPVIQPHMRDFSPTENGESPLSRATDWVSATCPACGGPAKRETDTMPGWAGSSWYYMRYLDPKNDKEFCRRDQLEKWLPVNHYNGGHEHDTRHLLYSRFWHKALYDLGLVPTAEPYARRTAQGLLLGNDGYKMSKSRNNGFMVADLIADAGADAGRMVVLSLGPWASNTTYGAGTLAGVQRFLKRVENLSDNLIGAPLDSNQEFLVNDLIAKMTQRIENMQFNTAISAMMEYINAFAGSMPVRAYEVLIQVLNPFAPHLTEEMWEKLGHNDMLVFEPWPACDQAKLVKTTVTIAVSVNGKHRGIVELSAGAAEADVIDAARAVAEKYLDGEIIKTIVVPNRMANFVTRK